MLCVLDLRRLRYFVAVAESRSFSRAAEQLLVAQSAVSRQVGLLERELGVRLLDRSTHEVQVTDGASCCSSEAAGCCATRTHCGRRRGSSQPARGAG